MNERTSTQLTRIRFHVFSPPADARYERETLAQLAGVHPELVRVYVQLGLLDPVTVPGDVTEWFDDRALHRLRTIQRLRQELGVNVNGAAVILELLEQIDELQRQLAARRS